MPGQLFVVIRDSDVLIEDTPGGPCLPARAAAAPFAEPPFPVGEVAGYSVIGAAAVADVVPPEPLRFVPVRALFATLDAATLDAVGRAMAAVEFETTHRFCGRCATATEAAPPPERARRCPRCGLSQHPRIPPAVIAVVQREHEILLARNARFPPGMFSAVAGFVEVGESLEQAVAREVAEEVGVRIDELRYFASQPWPFGRSLMVGFFARHAGGDIAVDGTEIEEAAWFPLDRLPRLPPPVSIARKLIEAAVAARARA